MSFVQNLNLRRITKVTKPITKLRGLLSTSAKAHHQHSPQVGITQHSRNVRVSELNIHGSDWAAKIEVGPAHNIIADTPHKKDGVEVDIGVSPKELLLCSLSSSAVMTIRSCYQEAIHKEEQLLSKGEISSWNVTDENNDNHWRHSSLESVNCEVREDQVDSLDLYTPRKVVLELEFIGKLTRDQKEYLIDKVATTCPITRMLTGRRGLSVKFLLRDTYL